MKRFGSTASSQKSLSLTPESHQSHRNSQILSMESISLHQIEKQYIKQKEFINQQKVQLTN